MRPPNRPNLRTPRRQSEIYCHIDVSALLSVFYVLFLLLILLQPPIHNGFQPEVAHAQYASLLPAAVREDAMHLAITRDGRFFFNTSQITPKDLPDLIRASVRNGSERRVYLIVDVRVKYPKIAMAAAEIQQTGIQDVSFIATESLISR